MIITLVILLILFSFQEIWDRYCREIIWSDHVHVVHFLVIVRFANMLQDLSVLRALNPIYGLKLLVSPDNHLGLFILGNVFLATTGAEALIAIWDTWWKS